jgi:hypothetical protein
MERAKSTVKIGDLEYKAVELTQAFVDDLFYDGKDGKSVTLKKVMVSETPYIERRVYKWANMPKTVVYDLQLPQTENELNALSLDTRLSAVWTAERIEKDKDNSGLVSSGGTDEEKAVKAIRKLAVKNPALIGMLDQLKVLMAAGLIPDEVGKEMLTPSTATPAQIAEGKKARK